MNDQQLREAPNELLQSLLSGNRMQCSGLVHKYLEEKVSIIDIYDEIIRKALYEVGYLWEYNKISVSTENIASAIIEALLNELYPDIISEKRINKKVVVACVENELHQIGVKMIGDVFEMHGWNAYFLGSDTHVRELLVYIKMINPDMLALSLSICIHLPRLEAMIRAIRAEYPTLPILVGGQAFSRGGTEVLEKFENVIFKPDLHSTEQYIINYTK